MFRNIKGRWSLLKGGGHLGSCRVVGLFEANHASGKARMGGLEV